MRYHEESSYDGRPSVRHILTLEDELLAQLVRVHGWEYAEDLLRQDAALRSAAEQAARRTDAAAPQVNIH